MLMCLCLQGDTFQLVLTSDGQRHAMIFVYEKIAFKGTVLTTNDLSAFLTSALYRPNCQLF